MDLQFNQSVIKYLRTVSREYQTQEQTQEIRIPDGMPDIGIVLACWGQPVLRGKEWRAEHVGITGGVMAKVLYLPEDVGVPQVVEVWLPFQMKWTIPGAGQDGTLTVELGVRSADARVLSARKLMVRVNVGAWMQAVVSDELAICQPDETPGDVQMLKNRYVLTLPKEAGEKAFALDEVLEFSASEPKPEQIVYIHLSPQVLEQKVLADKLIFRGLCIAHLLYRSGDGQLHSRDFDVPFSQYADLGGEFEPEATMQVFPIVTNLETELTPEGGIHLKAGMSGQYVIYDPVVADLVQDAYSPVRSCELSTGRLHAPALLQQTVSPVSVQVDPRVDVMRPVDLSLWVEQPYVTRDGACLEADIGGTFQMLYYDPEGQLQTVQTRWSETKELPVDPDADFACTLTCGSKPQFGSGMLCGDLLLNLNVTDRQGMDMVCGLKLGEPVQPDPNRPSLVITKAGDNSLWQLAKENGTTVDLICQANGLSNEPAPDSVLLIPIGM